MLDENVRVPCVLSRWLLHRAHVCRLGGKRVTVRKARGVVQENDFSNRTFTLQQPSAASTLLGTRSHTESIATAAPLCGLTAACPNMEDLAPEAFFCSISYALMRDPVSISDGHTFDRDSIEAWYVQHAPHRNAAT